MRPLLFKKKENMQNTYTYLYKDTDIQKQIKKTLKLLSD